MALTKYHHLFVALAIFSATLWLPNGVAHAATAQPFDDCTGALNGCGIATDLTCFEMDTKGYTTEGFSLGMPATIKKACLPQPNYTPCGSITPNCSGTGQSCAVVQQPGTPGKYGLACLDSAEYPHEAGGTNTCTTSADCDKGSQCMQIINTLDETIDKQVTARRCIPIGKLPPNLLEAGGVCGVNAGCNDNQYCVENTYNSGSHVCYDSGNKLANASCSSVGSSCGDGTNAGTCMNVIAGDTKILTCLKTDALPGGPNAPSDQTCKTDSDCTKDPGYTYCLLNPKTKKNQCFSQKNILSDLSTTAHTCVGDATKSCACSVASVGSMGCSPTTPDSICTTRPDFPLDPLCIAYSKDGAALDDGSAYNEATGAEERLFRTAPHVEIDIPNLNFTEKILGQTKKNGTEFFVPYLAQYIRAAIRYMIGFGVLLAVIMLMFAGFRWMTSFGNVKAVKTAQEMLSNSVLGLALLLGSYTLLYIVNPDLVNLKSFAVLAPKQEGWVAETGNSNASDGQVFEGGAVNIVAGQMPDYKQCDSKWAAVPYGSSTTNDLQCTSSHNSPPGSKATDTICKSGCGVTSLANVLAYYGRQVTPKDTAAFASKVGAHESCGGSSGEIICKNIASAYPGLSCRSVKSGDVTDIINLLHDKKPVIFSCHNCTGTTEKGNSRSYVGHYMIFTGVTSDGTKFSVMDGARKNDYITTIDVSQLTAGGKIVNMYVIEKK